MTTRPKTILVVDDDQDILKLLSKVLTSSGLRILTAPSVAEAKLILETFIPHAIISDLHMSPETGFDFIQFLRGHSLYSKIPVLF